MTHAHPGDMRVAVEPPKSPFVLTSSTTCSTTHRNQTNTQVQHLVLLNSNLPISGNANPWPLVVHFYPEAKRRAFGVAQERTWVHFSASLPHNKERTRPTAECNI